MNPIYVKLFGDKPIPLVQNAIFAPNNVTSVFAGNAAIQISDVSTDRRPLPHEGVGFGRMTSSEVGDIISGSRAPEHVKEVVDATDYCLKKHINVRLKADDWNAICMRGIIRYYSDSICGSGDTFHYVETTGIRSLSHILCVDGCVRYYLTRVETKNSYYCVLSGPNDTLKDINFSDLFDEYSENIRTCDVWHGFYSP